MKLENPPQAPSGVAVAYQIKTTTEIPINWNKSKAQICTLPFRLFVLLPPSLGAITSIPLDIVYHPNFDKTDVRNVKRHGRAPAVLPKKRIPHINHKLLQK